MKELKNCKKAAGILSICSIGISTALTFLTIHYYAPFKTKAKFISDNKQKLSYRCENSMLF